jgi:hypothetical protein
MNSMLSLYGRPVVMFDVDNKEHRRMAHRFLVERSWGNCPVRFALPIGEDNVHSMVMRLLTQHYSAKEFGPIPKTDQDRMRDEIVANAPQVVWIKENKG